MLLFFRKKKGIKYKENIINHIYKYYKKWVLIIRCFHLKNYSVILIFLWYIIYLSCMLGFTLSTMLTCP